MKILLGHQAKIFGTPDWAPVSPSTHSRCLARFFFVLGHLVPKLLIYTKMLIGIGRWEGLVKTVKK